MADFNTAYQLTKPIEGGYANVSGDRGGETYKGIARVFWPQWQGWEIIDNTKAAMPRYSSAVPGYSIGELNKVLNANALLQNMVDAFFRTHFWDQARLTEIIDQNIANELFDTGVNFSPGRAVLFLQQAINLTRKDIQVTEDKLIGPKTIAAVNSHSNIKALYKTLNVLQGMAYISDVWRNPVQEKFFIGWLTRVNFLQ